MMDLQNINRKRPVIENENFETVDTYLKIAKSLIHKFAPGMVKLYMIKDEDAVSNLATEIMFADWHYDPSKMSKDSWRIQYAKWAIFRYIDKRQKEILVEQIDHHDKSLYDEPIKSLDLKDLIKESIAKLSKDESKFLKQRFLEGMSIKDISETCQKSEDLVKKLTYAYVSNIIKKALRKLSENIELQIAYKGSRCLIDKN